MELKSILGIQLGDFNVISHQNILLVVLNMITFETYSINKVKIIQNPFVKLLTLSIISH